jgi:hypothetical protein
VPKERRPVSKQVGFKLPVNLIHRLEEHFARLQDESPGETVTMKEVVRILLTRALDDAESDRTRGLDESETPGEA